jgi:hypothetical protein
VQQALGLATAQMIGAGEQHHDGGQVRAERRAGNRVRVVRGSRPGTAARAAHFVPPPLCDVRAVVAQLQLLETARRGVVLLR